MLDFLTNGELLITARIYRAEVRLREESLKEYRKTEGATFGKVASGHDYVPWVMKLAAVEEEIKKRGL